LAANTGVKRNFKAGPDKGFQYGAAGGEAENVSAAWRGFRSINHYAFCLGNQIGQDDETSDGLTGVARNLRRPFARRGQFEWIKASAAVFVFRASRVREQ